jgi:hypothetical protein
MCIYTYYSQHIWSCSGKGNKNSGQQWLPRAKKIFPCAILGTRAIVPQPSCRIRGLPLQVFFPLSAIISLITVYHLPQDSGVYNLLLIFFLTEAKISFLMPRFACHLKHVLFLVPSTFWYHNNAPFPSSRLQQVLNLPVPYVIQFWIIISPLVDHRIKTLLVTAKEKQNNVNLHA